MRTTIVLVLAMLVFCSAALAGQDALPESITKYLQETYPNCEIREHEGYDGGYVFVLGDGDVNWLFITQSKAGDTAYGVAVLKSMPLPDDAIVDLSNVREDSIIDISLQNNGLNTTYTVSKQPDDTWHVIGVSGTDTFQINVFGLVGDDGQWRVGALADTNIESVQWNLLPATWEQALARLDQSGWARVVSDDPENCLHLREEPSRDAGSAAKFYMGTPVEIIRDLGDWVEVEIYGGLCGFMLKEWLAFDTDMNGMQTAFPQIIQQQEWLMKGPFDAGDAVILGVADNGSYYVVYPYSGNYGFYPESWFTAELD